MMNKSEILNLHTLSEDEQIAWLIANKVVQPRRPECPYEPRCGESLPEIAFRLRDEVSQVKYFHRVYSVAVDETEPPDMHVRIWALYEAKPIHWIMAALLAKESESE